MANRHPKDPLLNDRMLCDELGISNMTKYRWRRRGILPPPVVIAGRNYTAQSHIDALKARGDGSATYCPATGIFSNVDCQEEL